MQNVANYLCPFFGLDGKPIVSGRVYFLKPNTSAQTFESLTELDSADFVTIKDKDGIALENPLSLDSLGRFEHQPFVDEQVDFKMVVCYPTGLPSELHDETPSWDIAYTVFSKSQHVDVSISGTPTVPNIAALRLLDPTVGTALVLGYGSANDFCPPRVFKWVSPAETDNGGTKIRSSVTGHTTDGMWLLVPCDYVDVRWFGIAPNSTSDCSAQVIAIADAYTTMPIYFPKGEYYLSSHVTMKSAIVDRLAIFYPLDANEDIKFDVTESFENRGATFSKDENDHIVYPKVKGVLRVSWLQSPIDAALSSTALANVDEVIFDATKTTSSMITIEKRRVLVKKGITFPSTVTLAPTCHVYREETGEVSANLAKLGNDWMIEPDDTQTVPEFKISKGVSLIAKLKTTLIEFFVKVKMAVGFLIDSDNAWEILNDPQSDWNNTLVLKVQKLLCPNARFGNMVASAAGIANGIVSRSMRYDESFVAIIAAGNITFFDGVPVSQETYSNNTLYVSQIYNHSGWTIPSGSIVHIVAQEVASLQFCFPDSGLDCIFVIDFPWLDTDYSKSFKIVDSSSVVLSDLKVLGVFAINSSDFNLNRVVVRAPTAAERTKYVLDSSLKWIIDPFVM